MILSIDTTREWGSLALVAGAEVLEEILLEAGDGFSHVIFGHIAELLNRHRRTIRDVECFACASGPGSFTGVRVGLACAKGLAHATGKPIVTVSNLQALAAFGSLPLRATLLDARRGEVYGAVYNSELEIVQPEIVAPLETWLRCLPSGSIEIVGTETHAGLVNSTCFTLTQAPRALAAAIGRIAAGRFRRGLTLDPAEADANYVRRSDAELFWKDPSRS